jgi:hypothetical protein
MVKLSDVCGSSSLKPEATISGFFMCTWHGAQAELLARAGSHKTACSYRTEGQRSPSRKLYGRPTRQLQFPEMGRPKEA